MFRLNNYNFGRSALLGLGAGLLLTACGGGGGGGGSSSGGGESAAYQGVAGPLDAVQEPLSTQVLTPLSEAAAGTPLEGAVSCVDQVVVQDTIDVLDSILGAVDPTSMNDPQVAFAAAAENIQAAVNELLADLPVLLTSLAGQGDCTGTGGGASDGSNPLAGTPLAPLGDALAPLFAAGSGFGGGFGGEGGQTLDLTALQALTDQLSAAFNDGLSNLPAEVADAPVLGGLLVTLQTTFNDLNTTVAALDDGDGAATAGAIAGTLDNLLSNLLINVVPVGFIEEQAGQGGVFSSQIEAGIAAITEQLGSGLGAVLDPAFDALFGSATEQLIGGLNMLLTPIGEAITGGLSSGGGSGAGPTGTPLDILLAPLQGVAEALTGGLGGGGGEGGLTGTPLDLILDPIADLLQGGAGSCPLADTPLSSLCDLVSEFENQVASGGGGDLLGTLTGVIESVLGLLIPG
ncbi:hypothetical protein [Spongiibacter tropicus]|uniref:hypothetical protein n=1 Tax=Spongiibacter tropicus TaxID=454602 RepID=UPI0003B47BB9|nr:hypothetical protein [Spongiibacter tropicus]